MLAIGKMDEDWQGNENIRNSIVNDMKEIELSSEKLLNHIDLMVEEKSIN